MYCRVPLSKRDYLLDAGLRSTVSWIMASLANIQVTKHCIVLMGAFISLFPNRLKAPQGWKHWSLLLLWVLLNVKIITILFPFTVQKYIYPPVSKVHAGSFCVSVIHQTLIWTIGSFTCVRDNSYMCVWTHRGWAHQQPNLIVNLLSWIMAIWRGRYLGKKIQHTLIVLDNGQSGR